MTLSDAKLAEIEAKHVAMPPRSQANQTCEHCAAETPWPCDASLLAAEVRQLREAAQPALTYLDAVLKHDRPRSPVNERILLGIAVGLRDALEARDDR